MMANKFLNNKVVGKNMNKSTGFSGFRGAQR